jgi:hypothetical protein
MNGGNGKERETTRWNMRKREKTQPANVSSPKPKSHPKTQATKFRLKKHFSTLVCFNLQNVKNAMLLS